LSVRVLVELVTVVSVLNWLVTERLLVRIPD
jgi:hypothetical protein